MSTDDPLPYESRHGPRRLRLPAVLAAVSAVVLVVVVVLAVRDDARHRLDSGGVDEAGGLSRAQRTCDTVDDLIVLVERNARFDEVKEAADAAVEQGLAAYEEDPTWLPLASGVQAVRKGLQDDVAGTTRQGMATVRSECRRARSPAPPVPASPPT